MSYALPFDSGLEYKFALLCRWPCFLGGYGTVGALIALTGPGEVTVPRSMAQTQGSDVFALDGEIGHVIERCSFATRVLRFSKLSTCSARLLRAFGLVILVGAALAHGGRDG
jgi:hypothetical protein